MLNCSLSSGSTSRTYLSNKSRRLSAILSTIDPSVAPPSPPLPSPLPKRPPAVLLNFENPKSSASPSAVERQDTTRDGGRPPRHCSRRDHLVAVVGDEQQVQLSRNSRADHDDDAVVAIVDIARVATNVVADMFNAVMTTVRRNI